MGRCGRVLGEQMDGSGGQRREPPAGEGKGGGRRARPPLKTSASSASSAPDTPLPHRRLRSPQRRKGRGTHFGWSSRGGRCPQALLPQRGGRHSKAGGTAARGTEEADDEELRPLSCRCSTSSDGWSSGVDSRAP